MTEVSGGAPSKRSSPQMPHIFYGSNSAQQFVDADLAEGLGIHFLDDHGAVQAVFAVGGGQVAGDYHRARGDAAIGDFAGSAVIDLGALADIDAHGDHAVVFHDYAFHHF